MPQAKDGHESTPVNIGRNQSDIIKHIRETKSQWTDGEDSGPRYLQEDFEPLLEDEDVPFSIDRNGVHSQGEFICPEKLSQMLVLVHNIRSQREDIFVQYQASRIPVNILDSIGSRASKATKRITTQ